MSPVGLTKNDVPAGPAGPAGPADAAPTGQEASALLLALDRLMSVGTYYQPGHARYQAVTKECHDAVQQALSGRASVDIQVSETGLNVCGQLFPAGSREARRLYSLLDPLSIAVLKIHAGVTTEDLHAGLAVLVGHKNSLSSARTYEEAEITGLPAAVTALRRSLYLKTRSGAPGPQPGPDSPFIIEPNVIPAELLAPGADIQKAEREFVRLIKGILQHKRPKRGLGKGVPAVAGQAKAAEPALDVEGWIPDAAISAIRDMVKALGGTNSDPMIFEHLIGHAQAALQLSGDAELVNLVFHKLRKDLAVLSGPRAKLVGKAKGKKSGPGYTMTTEELRVAIEGLTVPFGPHQDPAALDRAATIGICLQVMKGEPAGELATGILETIEHVFSSPRFGEPEKSALAAAVAQLFTRPPDQRALDLFHLVWEPLRQHHPELVGPTWLEVWRLLLPKQREHAWPFTVNDLLLGMAWKSPLDALALYGAVSRIKVAGKSQLLYRLENLAALKEGRLGEEVFSPPPPLLFPVHQVLIGSSVSAIHGPLLHDHLLRLLPHPLSVTLLEAMTEYHPGNRVVYQAILEQGVADKVVPRLQEVAERLLGLALKRLPAAERRATWVKGAIGWLGKLPSAASEEAVNMILSEKRFWFFPAWPKECRLAADDAWMAMQGIRAAALDNAVLECYATRGAADSGHAGARAGDPGESEEPDESIE